MTRKRSFHLTLFALLIGMLFSVLAVSAQSTEEPTAAAEATAEVTLDPNAPPVVIGVSGPLTGDLAQYGAQWKKGFDLAIDEINAAGGIDGRKVIYQFEDSQADPKQSVIIAQKFVADPNIVVELGDFASTASMAASQIYTNGGLVQFGFTNSHPDFTKPSDYQWSNSVTQTQESPALADYTYTTLGLKKIAVFQQISDWGQSTNELFAQRYQELGGQIVSNQQYLPDEKDFSSAITTVKDAAPDGIVLLSYTADGALIAQQVRDAGLTVPFVATASVQSPDFISLGGKAVEGTHVLGEFLPSDPRPEVVEFVTKFRARYNEDPDLFATIAYDAVYIVVDAARLGGPTRQGIHDALPKLKDVPTVLYGKITFDPETRRVQSPTYENLIIKDGEFVAQDSAAS